jgi:hypothetical protein
MELLLIGRVTARLNHNPERGCGGFMGRNGQLLLILLGDAFDAVNETVKSPGARRRCAFLNLTL